MQHFSCMAGASCSVVVLTLPVFVGAPPLLVFQVLEWLAITLVYALLGLAVVSILVLVISLLVELLCCVKSSSGTPEQQEGLSCRRRVFLSMGRFLCVHTFPALFKLHKTRSESDQSQTSKFMVFLDRYVEDNVPLVAAFCSIVFCIFCSSTAAFFRYFPVERSAECLEKDSHGHSLFCYSNVNSSLNPNLPVDCANYSVTELRELEFECYAIVFPAGLGIAVAAAFGLAEVGIVGVTIFIKVTEGFFKKTKNLKDEPCCYCCCKQTCVNNTYVCSSVVLLVTVSLVSFSCAIIIFIYFCTIDRMHLLLLLYYLAYPLLSALLCTYSSGLYYM